MSPELAEVSITCTGDRSGYGQVAVGLREAFAELGISDDPHAGLVIQVNPTFALMKFYAGQELNCFTMWETTRIPELVMEKIDNFKNIIVPNEFNLRQFSEHHPNVHLVRLGLNPDKWEIKRRFKEPHKPFRVLTIGPKPGGNDLRKGFDLSQKAFDEAFPDADFLDPKPELVLAHTRGHMTDEELLHLYWRSHVYLSLSRGEGWHLLPFQMLATGAPVILSQNAGHAEWSWLPGVGKVSCSFVPSPIGGIGSSWSGEWWEPDVFEAAHVLRETYDTYASHVEDAIRGAGQIRQYLTWRHVGEAVLEIVGNHARPRADNEIVEPKARTFTAIPNKTGVADIGLTRYEFFKDTPIELPADPLRVLLTSGAVRKP